MVPKNPSNPDEIVHVQVKPGQVIRIGDHAYGDRGTPQIRRGDLDRIKGGAWTEVHPDQVPDVGDLPAAA